MYNIRIVSVFREYMFPEDFERIIHPEIAGHQIMSIPEDIVRTLFTCYRLFQPFTGENPYQAGRDLRRTVVEELRRGNLVALDDSLLSWSPGTALYYIDEKGRLVPNHKLLMYPSMEIIERYDRMVEYFRIVPPPTVRPAPVVNVSAASVAVQATPGKAMKQAPAPLNAMTRAERWQMRKALISKGSRSLYPDAQIAAKRLAENNIAVEKARLAENVYKTVNPLETTPDVPEGWRDISNDAVALSKLGLDSEMLYDDEKNPDFLARVYQPDAAVFGNDMAPTLVFRGSRAPEFAPVKENLSSLWNKGELAPVKNAADWTNNFAQGLGEYSDYYKRAVRIGDRLAKSGSIDIAGHSLGGGLASATSLASGKPGWTFNAAGLHHSTVEKYGGTIRGQAENIGTWRVQGELLTKIQEVKVPDDFLSLNLNIPAFVLKAGISALSPDAVGIPHDLPGGTGSALARHGIDQVIDCIEQQKDEDIAVLRSYP